MLRLRSATVAALGALALSSAHAQPPAAPAGSPTGQVLISLPGDRIENVYETADGALYATATFGNKVVRLGPDGKLSLFFSAPNPQGVIQVPGGFVVDYQTRLPEFTKAGPSTFSGLGPHMAMLDAKGQVLKTVEGDDKAFFNGIALYGQDAVFIADTGGGRILRADLKTGAIGVWLDKDALPGAEGRPNGMKVRNGWVYYSRGDVYRVKIGGDGKPSGAPMLAAKTGGTDDFDVGNDGAVYATHRGDVIKATPSGETSVVVAGGCPFCTATRITRDGKWLLLTGGSIPAPPGAPQTPGYVSKIPLP